MSSHILIIDDDQRLGELLSNYFRQFEMSVVVASKPSEGLSQLRAHPFDLVILDLMMPEKDGFAVCKEIRAESSIPIIMLTARGDVTDRIVGLELGADDYMPKPFEPRELVARIQTVLRRSEERHQPSAIFRSGALSLNIGKRTATLDGKELELTTAEYELLHLFMQKPGQTLSRDQIMDELRGVEWEAFNRAIDVAVSRLRVKLGDNPKSPTFFKTVWGTGYMFIGQIERVNSDDK